MTPIQEGLDTLIRAQIACCIVAAASIFYCVQKISIFRRIHYRAPTCVAALGLVITAGGFAVGIREVVKIGHITQNASIVLLIAVIIVRQMLRKREFHSQ